MPKPKAKSQVPICTECGSADIRSDAYAEWSVKRQEWELVTTFDNTDCENCGGECSVDWVDVASEEGRKGLAMLNGED